MANGYVGIPASYTPVEYIESSGTQCIDTGVVRDIAHKYRYVANLSWGNVSTRQCVGAQGYVYFGVTSGYYQVAQGGTTHTSATATANTFVGIDLTFNCPARTCTGTAENQSISVSSISYENVPANAHIHLFSLNDLVLPSSTKIASFKIYQNDVLVRDFIPVIDQGNVACMYEQVEGKFYYNAGSGTFAAGAATGQPVSIGSRARKLKKGYVGIPASYTPVEYIESSGTQYIDTAYYTNSTTKLEYDVAVISGNSNTWIPLYRYT